MFQEQPCFRDGNGQRSRPAANTARVTLIASSPTADEIAQMIAEVQADAEKTVLLDSFPEKFLIALCGRQMRARGQSVERSPRGRSPSFPTEGSISPTSVLSVKGDGRGHEFGIRTEKRLFDSGCGC